MRVCAIAVVATSACVAPDPVTILVALGVLGLAGLYAFIVWMLRSGGRKRGGRR